MTEPAERTISVAVVGAHGRMGSLAASTIEASPALHLAAKVGRGDPLPSREDAEVLVDFSTPSSAYRTAEWGIRHGIHVIIGTTGLTDRELSSLEDRLGGPQPRSAVMVIPNFSVAALLTRKFAALAVRYFDSCEIIEFAHPLKADAPSGTAIETAKEIAQAMECAGLRGLGREGVSDVPNSRGATVAGIQVHSVRMEGMMNHQTVLLGGTSDVMTLRYDTYDRRTYMAGMKLAISKVVTRRGFFRGLESVIEI